MLKAPFPWFGGKSRVAHLVWQRFGDVPNYVEPFAGSLAVLLARPTDPGTETVNDLDCYLANFWRAVRFDPGAVVTWAAGPVSEIDLRARHKWLLDRVEFRERMGADPEFFDARIAGWWAWGICSSIGEAFLRKTPQSPSGNLSRRGYRSSLNPDDYLAELSARLQDVNILCGDWGRCLSDSRLFIEKPTAVLLDPPYDSDCSEIAYGTSGVSSDVAAWAREHGDDPRLRIALCGYEGEHNMPDSWAKVEWKAAGGYGSMADGQARENAHRERIWFSPHCIQPERSLPLFDLWNTPDEPQEAAR